MRTEAGTLPECPRCGQTDGRRCCAGCVLAAATPRDAQGNFPVTRQLVTALGAGFLLFNQALFAGFVLLVPPNEPAWTPRLEAGSLAAGLLAWLVLAVAQWRSTGPVPADALAALASVALLGYAMAERSVALGLVAVVAWTAWTARGLLRGKSAVDRADPV